MKNIKYILFIILFFICNILYVDASCTSEDIYALKSESKKIKVTYKHKGIIESEERTLYNQFDVTIKNIYNDFYVTLLGESVKLEPVNGAAKIELSNGEWYFKIYSNKCNSIIDEIRVFLPKFNLYSLDPLCEGIDGDDFPLCGKYYEYNVDYDEFEQRVTSYRKLQEDTYIENEKDGIGGIFNYLFKYRFYILGFMFAVFLILILIIVIKKRRKRVVLE